MKQADLARRQIDDAPAVAQPARRLSQRVERTLEVDRNVAVEPGVITIGQARQPHDPGIVDQHFDTAERQIRHVEHARYGRAVADVRLCGDRAAICLLNLSGQPRPLRPHS